MDFEHCRRPPAVAVGRQPNTRLSPCLPRTLRTLPKAETGRPTAPLQPCLRDHDCPLRPEGHAFPSKAFQRLIDGRNVAQIMAAGEVAGRESNAHLFEMLNDK